jgi:hypothetical protein
MIKKLPTDFYHEEAHDATECKIDKLYTDELNQQNTASIISISKLFTKLFKANLDGIVSAFFGVIQGNSVPPNRT